MSRLAPLACALLLTASAVADDRPLLEGPAVSDEKLAEQIDGLQHRNVVRRIDAARAITRMGPAAKAAVPALKKALTHADPDLQAAAADALGAIGREAAPAAPELIALFRVRDFTSDDRPVVLAAHEALVKIGPAALPKLIEAVESPHAPVRRGALLTIGRLGAGEEALQVVMREAEKNDPETRGAALYALGGFGPAAKPAIPILVSAFQDETFQHHSLACHALGAIGPEAKVAVPDILDRLKNGLTSVRGNAAKALGNIGPEIGDEAIAALIETLDAYNQSVREDAAVALGKLGPAAKAAIPALREAVQDEQFAPRVQAAHALWRIDPDDDLALATLGELLGEFEHAWMAAEVLAELGPAAKPVLPELTAALKAEDSLARFYAAEALRRLGRDARPAVPALREALQDDDEEVRTKAAEALREIESTP